jgi:Rrf2 family protein
MREITALLVMICMLAAYLVWHLRRAWARAEESGTSMVDTYRARAAVGQPVKVRVGTTFNHEEYGYEPLRPGAREGLVATQRGRDGGYWLALAPVDVSYGDIVRLTRGSLALTPCASRFAHETCTNCLPESECRLHRVMLRVRDETAKVLDSISLAERFVMDETA